MSKSYPGAFVGFVWYRMIYLTSHMQVFFVAGAPSVMGSVAGAPSVMGSVAPV